MHWIRKYFYPYNQIRKRGWAARHVGRDTFEYCEMVDGELCRISIDGEMMAGESPAHVVYVLTEREWLESMPSWAKQKRSQIIGNLKSLFREPEYCYDDRDSDVDAERKLFS